MDALSRAVVDAGGIGLFVYGVLNRLLIVTGLHHILNNLAWFLLGDYNGVTGDLKRFFAGDPTAGAFMSGLLPGDDVRPARRVPRDVPHGTPRAAPRRRRPAALDGAHLVPDRRDRADRVHLHVPRAGALRRARGADRRGDGADGRARRAARLRLLGGPVRLRAQLQARRRSPLLLLPVGAAYFALYFGLFRWAIVRFNLRHARS